MGNDMMYLEEVVGDSLIIIVNQSVASQHFSSGSSHQEAYFVFAIIDT